MNTRMLLLGAAIAGSFCTSLTADVLELNLGRFAFNGSTTAYDYEGDWSSALGSDVEGDVHSKTVATVDLGAVISAAGGRQIAWIRIDDPGDNWYNGSSPGADIDLFAVAGLAPEMVVTYSYDGPMATYASWSSDDLAAHVAKVDHEPYSGTQTPWWIATGRFGSLTMTFDGWPANDPGDADSGADSGGDDLGGGDAGSGGSDGGDTGGGDSGGGVLDGPSALMTSVAIPQVDDRDVDGGLIEPSWSFTGLQLRLNEVAPTREWFNVTIGFTANSFFVPVPGPGALGVMGIALRLRRRRR